MEFPKFPAVCEDCGDQFQSNGTITVCGECLKIRTAKFWAIWRA